MNHPCETCKVRACNNMCRKWQLWFREKWTQIRRMYGMEDRDNEKIE